MGGWIASGILALAVVIGLIGWCTSVSVSHWIHNDEALERFQELAGTDDVVIVKHSNNTIFGDVNDVTYELLVNGKPTSGRCTSGDFSPMVCRIYSGLEGD